MVTILTLFMLLLTLSGVAYVVFGYTKQNTKQNTKKNTKQSSKIGSNERIIVYFKQNKYDLTEYAGKHPGGKKLLIDNIGKDIQQLMEDNGHSIHAYDILEKYKI